MNLTLDKNNSNDTSKSEMELVQREKQEYKLIGSFLRTPGLRLFYYDFSKDFIGELVIDRGRTIHLVPKDGKLVPVDFELQKVLVDPRNEFFEKLNYPNAVKWVEKYKRGELKTLCNLMIPGELKFF